MAPFPNISDALERFFALFVGNPGADIAAGTGQDSIKIPKTEENPMVGIICFISFQLGHESLPPNP
jgi:hypothetical protein